MLEHLKESRRKESHFIEEKRASTPQLRKKGTEYTAKIQKYEKRMSTIPKELYLSSFEALGMKEKALTKEMSEKENQLSFFKDLPPVSSPFSSFTSSSP